VRAGAWPFAMRRIVLLVLQAALCSPELVASGWPRNGCAECVRLLEEPLISVPSYTVAKPAPAQKGRLLAGASRVDITPPPGFPMGGSGPAATFGRGYWTRLYARAIFFRDVEGQTLALVSCDLGAMSGGLQAQVAWLLRNDPLNLTRENLVLAATHTHQGPGNFLSSKVYNDQGSPAQGFDPKLFSWLADRIASAVREAARRADEQPADSSTEIVFKQGMLLDLLRNRAPDPFLLNPDRDEVMAAGPPAGPSCPEPHVDVCPRYRAVDGRLSLLEVERMSGSGARERVASLVFLSVHPEAMSHETALYQSDFTGLAMALLERRDPARKLVTAFFNGAEGDISVRWKLQNRNEAVRFARSLVQAIDQADATSGVRLDSRGRFLVMRTEIPANRYFTGPGGSFKPRAWCEPRGSLCLAEEPLFGVATAGGAEDARTMMFDLGWKPGVRWPAPRDGQGVKQGAFESRMLPGVNLTAFVAPSCFYPESIPLSLISFQGSDPLTFAAVPGELTRTAWWRIQGMLERVPGLGHALPLGLANDYLFYFPTREEYAAQGYEGASDIFGPFTAEVIRAELAALALGLHPPIAGKETSVPAAAYYPDWRPHHDLKLLLRARSGTDSFGPEWLGVAYPDPDEGLENLIVDDKDIPYRHWPRFRWNEEGVDDWGASGREVRILSLLKTPVDDDSGPNVLTVYRNPPPTGREGVRAHSRGDRMQRQVTPLKPERGRGGRGWMAIWLSSDKAMQDTPLYFSVTINDSRRTTKCSEAFTLREVWSRPPRSIPEAPCP
jgi:neutral ceramidase